MYNLLLSFVSKGNAQKVSYFSTAPLLLLYNKSLFYFSNISLRVLFELISHISSRCRYVLNIFLRNLKDALSSHPFLHVLFSHFCNISRPLEKRVRVFPLTKVKSPYSVRQMQPIANLCLHSKVLVGILLVKIVTYNDLF